MRTGHESLLVNRVSAKLAALSCIMCVSDIHKLRGVLLRASRIHWYGQRWRVTLSDSIACQVRLTAAAAAVIHQRYHSAELYTRRTGCQQSRTVTTENERPCCVIWNGRATCCRMSMAIPDVEIWAIRLFKNSGV